MSVIGCGSTGQAGHLLHGPLRSFADITAGVKRVRVSRSVHQIVVKQQRSSFLWGHSNSAKCSGATHISRRSVDGGQVRHKARWCCSTLHISLCWAGEPHSPITIVPSCPTIEGGEAGRGHQCAVTERRVTREHCVTASLHILQIHQNRDGRILFVDLRIPMPWISAQYGANNVVVDYLVVMKPTLVEIISVRHDAMHTHRLFIKVHRNLQRNSVRSDVRLGKRSGHGHEQKYPPTSRVQPPTTHSC